MLPATGSVGRLGLRVTSALLLLPMLAQTGKLLQEATVHEDCIQDMQLSPDGAYVITASLDKTARLIDLDDFSVRGLSTQQGPAGVALSVGYHSERCIMSCVQCFSASLHLAGLPGVVHMWS
jgi:WD40 repeat protein